MINVRVIYSQLSKTIMNLLTLIANASAYSRTYAHSCVNYVPRVMYITTVTTREKPTLSFQIFEFLVLIHLSPSKYPLFFVFFLVSIFTTTSD